MPRLAPHPAAMRRAVEALLRDSDASYYEIAARTGAPYEAVCRWNRVGSFRPVALRASHKRGLAPALAAIRRGQRDPQTLNAALCMHVAREIASLDFALRKRTGDVDALGKLRDLAELAGILDTLSTRAGHPEATRRGGARQERKGQADAGSQQRAARLDPGDPFDAPLDEPFDDPLAGYDLDALRLDLARRVAAALGEPGGAGLRREPAAAAPGGGAA